MESYFGLTAVESSYNHGEEWLEQLIDYLEGNLNTLLRFIQTELPEIKVVKPEGTYMVWMDCSAISADPKELKKLMFEQAGVAFSEGSVFGKQGAGFLRVNLACPRSILEAALERFANSVRKAAAID
jgi:cystathionine beta-lyase